MAAPPSSSGCRGQPEEEPVLCRAARGMYCATLHQSSSAFGFVLWVSRLRVSRAAPPPSIGRHAPCRPDGLIRWRLPHPLLAAEGNRKRSLCCAARRAVCIALRCTRVLSLRLRPLGELLARLTGCAPTIDRSPCSLSP